MIAFNKIRKRFPIGTRVRFTRDEERYPSFSVPEGTTGTVTESNQSALYVRVDEFVEGLSDSLEWWGEFSYTPEDAEHDDEAPFEDTEVPEPDPRVVAAVPEDHPQGLTAYELIEVLKQLDSHAPVQMTTVIDGAVMNVLPVQGVRVYSDVTGSIDLVGSDTYRPEQIYRLS